MTTTKQDALVLFDIWDTPIKAEPAALLNLVALWGTMTWLAGRRRPERSWPTRLAVGALSAATLTSPDFAHVVGHIISARLANAPVDEIVLPLGMPRTLYSDDEVPPGVHRMRALGGPVLSGVSFFAGLLFRRYVAPDSLGRELLDWACLGHGFIFVGSLMPLPMIDGGTILKWTLVEQGRTPAEADAVVKQVDLALGAAAATAGVALATRRRWWPALGCIAAGIFAIGAALGKIR